MAFGVTLCPRQLSYYTNSSALCQHPFFTFLHLFSKNILRARSRPRKRPDMAPLCEAAFSGLRQKKACMARLGRCCSYYNHCNCCKRRKQKKRRLPNRQQTPPPAAFSAGGPLALFGYAASTVNRQKSPRKEQFLPRVFLANVWPIIPRRRYRLHRPAQPSSTG